MGVGAPKASPRHARLPSLSGRTGTCYGRARSCRPDLRQLAACDDAALPLRLDLARVLAACDGEDRLRDRAVILLLARLGLRASEVAHLSFERSTGRMVG